MRSWHRRFAAWLRLLNRRRQAGQAMVEYGLLFALIIVVVLVTLITVGNQLLMTYQDIEASIAYIGGESGTTAFTCPDGSISQLHGHKYWCHP